MRGVAVALGGRESGRAVGGLEVVAVEHVSRLRELAEGGIEPVPPAAAPESRSTRSSPISRICRGHPVLRRCLEIAAAGAHSLLLIGPPGGGKTLAPQRLPSLLPPLSRERGDRGDPHRRRLR